jgi:myosin heavy subunit
MKMESFECLKKSECYVVEQIDDVLLFKEILEALNVL